MPYVRQETNAPHRRRGNGEKVDIVDIRPWLSVDSRGIRRDSGSDDDSAQTEEGKDVREEHKSIEPDYGRKIHAQLREHVKDLSGSDFAQQNLVRLLCHYRTETTNQKIGNMIALPFWCLRRDPAKGFRVLAGVANTS